MFGKLFLHKKKTSQFNAVKLQKHKHHNSYPSNGRVNVLEIKDDVLEVGIINNGAI